MKRRAFLRKTALAALVIPAAGVAASLPPADKLPTERMMLGGSRVGKSMAGVDTYPTIFGPPRQGMSHAAYESVLTSPRWYAEMKAAILRDYRQAEKLL